MVWRDDSVTEARLQAVHDGKTLIVRLSWADPSRDDLEHGKAGKRDAAAIQFSPSKDVPPLFGMGSKKHPVNIWH